MKDIGKVFSFVSPLCSQKIIRIKNYRDKYIYIYIISCRYYTYILCSRHYREIAFKPSRAYKHERYNSIGISWFWGRDTEIFVLAQVWTYNYTYVLKSRDWDTFVITRNNRLQFFSRVILKLNSLRFLL